MTDEEDKAPGIGYMNPPEHTRFRKGTSGNPRGRPRKREDLNTVLARVLDRKVRVKDNDQMMPIREALIWKLRELALQGDKQALALQRRIIDEAGLAQPESHSPEEIKLQVLRAFERMGVKVERTEGRG
jgi:hypothetical protein